MPDWLASWGENWQLMNVRKYSTYNYDQEKAEMWPNVILFQERNESSYIYNTLSAIKPQESLLFVLQSNVIT